MRLSTDQLKSKNTDQLIEAVYVLANEVSRESITVLGLILEELQIRISANEFDALYLSALC